MLIGSTARKSIAPMGCGPLRGPVMSMLLHTSMLLLYQRSIHAASGVTVPCRINRWVSDNIDSSYDGVEYEWVDCKDSSSEKIYLLGGDQKRLAEFSTGDDAELNLQPVSGSNARSAGVVGDSAESEVYEIADVLSHARSSDLARSASNDVRTVLIIRMEYNDHQSSCDEQCCLNGIYSNQNQGGVTGSIAGVYETSSYGKTTWPNTASARKVVSVTMGKNVVTDSCAYRTEGSVADSKLSQRFPRVKLSNYRHIEYIMPEEFGRSGNTDKCNGMAGVANVNCQHPNAAVRNGVCYSYIRTTLQMVRAHEFGHNLGLGHSGQYTDEYGDSSAVMGYSRPSWLVFNAAHRFQLGWLAADDVADASYVHTSALYNIAELNTGLAATDLPHAVRFSCPSCQAARFRGGHIFLSFRGDDGYDAAVTLTHRNKILVHQAETYYTGLYGGRTHLHKVLSEGDSWQMAGFSIYFCAKTANSAKVVVARIIPATLIALCNDASLLLPRTPLKSRERTMQNECKSIVEMRATLPNNQLAQKEVLWTQQNFHGKTQTFQNENPIPVQVLQPYKHLFPKSAGVVFGPLCCGSLNDICACKTCAVVGASSSLLNVPQGHLIDRHQTVLRVNRIFLKGFEAYTGTRTDVNVMFIMEEHLKHFQQMLQRGSHGTIAFASIMSEFGMDRYCRYLDRLWIMSNASASSRNSSYQRKLEHTLPRSAWPQITPTRVFMLSDAVYHMAMIHMCHATQNGTQWKSAKRKKQPFMRPSTGFMTVVAAMAMCEKVSLYGMDDPGRCSGFHYYEKQRVCNATSKQDKPIHWFEMEHAMYRAWHEQRKVQLFS